MDLARLVIAVIGAFACASCDAGSSVPPPQTSTSVTTQPVSTSATVTTTNTMSASAADGTDLQACFDLACEVMVKRGDVITVKKVGDLPVLSTDNEGIVLRTPIGPEKIEVGHLFSIQDTVFITPSLCDSTGAIIQIRPSLHDTEPT